jgi:son of sevenless-like protein
MLTYRSFTDSLTVCHLLFERFMMEPPNAILEEHLRLWIEKKQTPVRLRIYNVIKSWIENYCEDMDVEALNAIKNFAQTVMIVEMEQFAEPLVKLVEKRLAMKNSQRAIIQPLVKDIATPIVPKKITKLVELDPLEVARQLTLIESDYFSSIHTHEFLRKSWSDKENNKSINVKKMIALSNKV